MLCIYLFVCTVRYYNMYLTFISISIYVATSGLGTVPRRDYRWVQWCGAYRHLPRGCSVCARGLWRWCKNWEEASDPINRIHKASNHTRDAGLLRLVSEGGGGAVMLHVCTGACTRIIVVCVQIDLQVPLHIATCSVDSSSTGNS